MTQKDSHGNYIPKDEPTAYVADDLGKFYLAFTPGTTWKIEVDFESHDLCYAGNNLKINECKDSNNGISSKPSFVLKEVKGGESVIFLDMTPRFVDLGLYVGACETPYEDYELMITPANGCGASFTVYDPQITDVNGKWYLRDPEDPYSNYRRWPYSAMDYYIQLDTAPDVSALIQEEMEKDDKNRGMSCKPPGSNIMQFFRDRNVLVQTLMLLNNEVADAKYVYHGWLCAIPLFSDAWNGIYDSFTQIKNKEVCPGLNNTNPTNLDLTKMHLIGATETSLSTLKADDVSENKYVSLKIFEAHASPR